VAVSQGPWHTGAAPPPAGGGRRSARLALRGALGVVGLLVAGVVALEATGWWLGRAVAPAPAVDNPQALRAETEALRRKLEKGMPRGRFIVIDTARNRLWIRDGEKVVREVVVSCGSGGVLQDPTGKKTWVFDTPRGERTIRSKATNPTWIKPDWAFYEEGEAVPKKFDDRVEEGVLGDYALGIGDGYFLHGTLYTRLLGRNVTHGCVRIGDADLEYIFKNSPLGTKVYLY
jgi:L,D-transpeptidase YbiS